MICENCGRSIGKLETPYIRDDHVVCAECFRQLKAEHDLVAAVNTMAARKGINNPATNAPKRSKQLRPCPACGHQISRSATRCPNCGRAVGISVGRVLLLLLVLFLLAQVLSWLFW
jgi:predicted amidophosphoribosyltransferase